MRSVTRSIKGGTGGVLEFWDGTKQSDKLYLFIQTCIKSINKLVSSLSGTPLVLGQATGNFGLTILTTA